VWQGPQVQKVLRQVTPIWFVSFPKSGTDLNESVEGSSRKQLPIQRAELDGVQHIIRADGFVAVEVSEGAGGEVQLLRAYPISGFSHTKSGKEVKSRSADHSFLMPW